MSKTSCYNTCTDKMLLIEIDVVGPGTCSLSDVLLLLGKSVMQEKLHSSAKTWFPSSENCRFQHEELETLKPKRIGWVICIWSCEIPSNWVSRAYVKSWDFIFIFLTQKNSLWGQGRWLSWQIACYASIRTRVQILSTQEKARHGRTCNIR